MASADDTAPASTGTALVGPADPAPRPGRRLPALDVLRGLAILGTLLTNIWIFSTASVSSIEDLGSVG